MRDDKTISEESLMIKIMLYKEYEHICLRSEYIKIIKVKAMGNIF